MFWRLKTKFSRTQIFALLYSGSFRFFFIFQFYARITVTQTVMIIGIILKIRILLNNNNINSIDNNPMTSKQRKRNIIWFNPPSSKNEARKIGRYFLKLIYKDFPRDHQFHKSFNRNNLKLSYSCMPNIKSAINSHNRKILHPPVSNQRRTCKCINKTDCLLQEKCLWKNTLYQADISSEKFQIKIYYNISETKFKRRYFNHKKSFNHKKHENDRNYRINSEKLKI